MSRIAVFFLLVISPILAILLALLGIETIPANPLGWFLFLVGVAYIAGLVIAYAFRRERFWDSALGGASRREEHGDRSFWLISLGLVAAFFVSPLEYRFLSAALPRNNWMASGGGLMVFVGIMLFVEARRALRMNYSGHLSVKSDQTLVQSGPYRVIRHPAYAGYFLMAVGLSLGYSSLVGLASVLILLLPSLVYRINIEEKLLAEHFGDAYRLYMQKTKRLIPGIW